MITIEELGPGDWERWREIRLAALLEAPEMFGSVHADWVEAGEDRWRSRLTAVPLHALAILDGAAAGVLSVDGPDGDGDLALISMWVAPFARGLGVGDALVGRAIGWATDHHPGAPLRLDVREHNAPAIALYKRHGFVVRGRSSQDRCEIDMRRRQAQTP